MGPKNHSLGLTILFTLIAHSQPLAQSPARDASQGTTAGDVVFSNHVAALFQDLPTVIEQAGIPGMSIAVVEVGKRTQVAAFGVCKAPDGPPVEKQTVFEAASLTKPLFAYGVLRLVERGELDLDRPLTSYVAFPDVQGDERVHQITARIVLSHTTGFPNWRRDAPLSIGPDPGTEFGYSGEGFVFLQKAVEAITGQPMETFLRSEILEPLGMTSSYLTWTDDLTTRTATGHDFLENPHPKWKPAEANAASTLHTTAGDYALFLVEMMQPTLVDPDLVAQMLSPQPHVADGVFWGLGWGLETSTLDDGSTEPMFWHWGSNGYFKCFTLSSPSRGRGLIFFTNSENGLAIAAHVVERTFGGKHPALAWRAWTEYDAPAFRIQRALATAALARGAEGVRAKYTSLRKAYALESFEESMMNSLGYNLLHMQAVEGAVEIFRLNTEIYPDSWNAFDSFGEGLMALGKKDEAITSYERSLSLNPDNANGRAMLERLRSESTRTKQDAGR